VTGTFHARLKPSLRVTVIFEMEGVYGRGRSREGGVPKNPDGSDDIAGAVAPTPPRARSAAAPEGTPPQAESRWRFGTNTEIAPR